MFYFEINNIKFNRNENVLYILIILRIFIKGPFPFSVQIKNIF